jgi:hypothetical protein
MSPRQCGLLKFFGIQGMRSQLRLLEYLVHMWYVNEHAFCMVIHTLTKYIEDIYFLTGLSHHGSLVSIIGSKGGGEPMDYYVHQHCVPGTKKHSGKVAIRDVWVLPLQTILYTITCMAESEAPHMDFQIHFHYAIDCMEPIFFNWCEGVLKSMKKQLTNCRNGRLK